VTALESDALLEIQAPQNAAPLPGRRRPENPSEASSDTPLQHSHLACTVVWEGEGEAHQRAASRPPRDARVTSPQPSTAAHRRPRTASQRAMVCMPQTAYMAVMQYLAETPMIRSTHLRRWQLEQAAGDYLNVSTAAMCLQRAAIVRVVMWMLLSYERREAAHNDMLGARWYRQQDRAMLAIPSLLPHVTVTHRVRQLVREHQIATHTLSVLLNEHPMLRVAAARIQQRAEENFQEDDSSTSADDTDEQ